jgi:putative spermidine/putrescine transport system substrate-binding protein
MKLSLRAALAAALLAAAGAAGAQNAICYNCPPEWADWASQLKSIKSKTGITVPPDNKNSGQTLSQLVAEKASPVADIAYYGVTFGIQAKKEGVVAPYKPAHWNEIPDGLKDAEGAWFTIHSGTLGLMVNVDALKGKPVPKSWKDLLHPQYRGLVGYLDPASAFVGYVGAVAVNQAMAGDLGNFDRAIQYFKELQKNSPIVPKQTSYARVLSGEIPILFDYDFNAYRAKYKDQANVAFVIPAEGTLVVPYVMSLVAKGPNPANGRKVLDHLMSDDGQAIWANAFLRPVRAKAISQEAQARFLPASEYARAKTVDYGKMAEAQRGFSERYLKEVQ